MTFAWFLTLAASQQPAFTWDVNGPETARKKKNRPGSWSPSKINTQIFCFCLCWYQCCNYVSEWAAAGVEGAHLGSTGKMVILEPGNILFEEVTSLKCAFIYSWATFCFAGVVGHVLDMECIDVWWPGHSVDSHWRNLGSRSGCGKQVHVPICAPHHGADSYCQLSFEDSEYFMTTNPQESSLRNKWVYSVFFSLVWLMHEEWWFIWKSGQLEDSVIKLNLKTPFAGAIQKTFWIPNGHEHSGHNSKIKQFMGKTATK